MRKTVIAAAASVLFAAAAHAQTAAPTTPAPAPPPQYGQPGVTLEQATAAVVAAAAEAKKNGWLLAIAVVSNGGQLVHFSKMDQTQFALGADRDRQGQGCCRFPRPTKVFEDRIAQGGAGIAVMSLDGIIASEGGIPLMRDGKIIGGYRLQRRQPVSRTASPAKRAWTRSSRFAISRELRGRGGNVAALCFSVPPVADQRLFLPPDQDEDRTEDTEHQPGRRCEHIG